MISPALLGRRLAPVFLLLAARAAQGGAVFETSLAKVKPDSPHEGPATIEIAAARNEYESFAIILNGPLSGVTVEFSSLTGPQGTIPASCLLGFRAAYLKIATASNYEGDTGLFPDALIPGVDPYAGEERNAFPVDVPPGENRTVWVDLFVPPGTPAGRYAGTVRVRSSSSPDQFLPYSLTVWNFDLPSTSSLPIAFGYEAWSVLRGHYGEDGMDNHYDQIVPLAQRYADCGLMHRVTLSSCLREEWDLYDDPIPWEALDARWGSFFDGRDLPFGLKNARLTSLEIPEIGDTPEGKIAFWEKFCEHYRAQGWFDLLFDYTFDEPSEAADYQAIRDRVALLREADPGLRSLVTADIQEASQFDAQTVIDIWVPIINVMDGKPYPACWDPQSEYAGSQRTLYDPLLAAGAELWWYQSCMSHGCDGADPDDACESEYPSYMVDHSSVKNRVMSWMSYYYDVRGELYFDVNYCDAEGEAWVSTYYFGGNGDGTLIYPGRPDVIGGTTHIPIESIRMKQIRDGMEDYEYFRLLENLAGRDTVLAILSRAVTNAYTYSGDGAVYREIRRGIGERLSRAGAPRVMAGSDFDGDGTSEIAVFRPASGLWAVRGITRLSFGAPGSLPVNGDHDGDGTDDIAVFSPSSGLWAVRAVTRFFYGNSSDSPVPSDLDGDGTADSAVFREATGLWAIRGSSRFYLGTAGDFPIASDSRGDRTADVGIFRPGLGLWTIRGATRFYLGGSSDLPVYLDHDGDGTESAGIFRPASGLWTIRGLTRFFFGSAGDIPCPADPDGNGSGEPIVFRGGQGLWAARGLTRLFFGSAADIPVAK